MRFLNYYRVKITNRILKTKILLFAAVVYSISILILSLVKLQNVDIIKIENSDKIYHTTCYGLMTILWLAYFKLKFKTGSIKKNLILAVAIITFGIIIEFLQLKLTTHRQFEWLDILANTIGVILGLVLVLILQKVFNDKKI